MRVCFSTTTTNPNCTVPTLSNFLPVPPSKATPKKTTQTTSSVNIDLFSRGQRTIEGVLLQTQKKKRLQEHRRPLGKVRRGGRSWRFLFQLLISICFLNLQVAVELKSHQVHMLNILVGHQYFGLRKNHCFTKVFEACVDLFNRQVTLLPILSFGDRWIRIFKTEGKCIFTH